MKKKNFKNLALNKKAISSFENEKLKGGDPDTFGCLSYRGWTCPHDATDYCFTNYLGCSVQ